MKTWRIIFPECVAVVSDKAKWPDNIMLGDIATLEIMKKIISILLIVATYSFSGFSIEPTNGFIEIDYIIIEYKAGDPVCIYKRGGQYTHLHDLGIKTLVSYGSSEKDKLYLNIKGEDNRYILLIEQQGKLFEHLFLNEKIVSSYSLTK